MKLRLSFLPFFIAVFSVFHLSAQSITSLSLINANTNQPIGDLTQDYVINLTEIGSELNIRANTTGTIGSVKFFLDGTAVRTESTAPYAFAGDTDGDYWVWTPPLGNHTVKAIAYSEGGGAGSELSSIEINFTVEGTQNDIVFPTELGTGEVIISGETKKWHNVTLTFDGPSYAETDNDPNPFLDLRLNVTFTQGDLSYLVPGYFAVDGNAGESSATSGNKWRVHFTPPTTGEWSYTASFRIGRNIAISDNSTEGDPIGSIDGKAGAITILESDKNTPDFRSKGRLEYVGEHFLKFAETGEYFVKGGPDAPENFLAYEDFDNTPNEGNRRKSWAPHANDWKTGDPSWQDGKGTEIIGALNYLNSEGLNAFSFLTMNIGGDDKNVYPYVTNSDFKHFDCSKLDQWEIVFTHGQKLGLYLHFKTQETENDQLLDGGDLGRNRKLYYRELIARYAHHLALNWNLGEENTQTVQQRKEMAKYFREHDPYQNHIVIHSYPDQQEKVYAGLLGDQSEITGASVQTGWNKVYQSTLTWVERSRESSKKWVVANDEQGSANTGVPHDDYAGSPTLDQIRQQTLWGNLMAGGAGVEYYFGYQLPNSDLSCQDYRSRDRSWDYVKIAIGFFSALPVQNMQPNANLVSSGWALADEGRTYLVYLPSGGNVTLDIAVAGNYEVKWFNPRSGGALLDGSVLQLTESGKQSIGTPPSEPNSDWAALITRQNAGDNQDPEATFTADVLEGTAPLKVNFNASESTDPDGTIESYAWDFGDGITGAGKEITHTFESRGSFEVQLLILDDKGGFDRHTKTIKVASAGSCGSPLTISSVDFDKGGFYIDNYTGTNLLAIQPNETTGAPVTATASATFTGESCNYNLIFHGVGESDGEAAFKIYIDDLEVGAYNIPLSTQNWEIGSKYNLEIENLEIAQNATIKVEGSTASADGKEWSRARWLKLEILPATCGEAGVFEESDGYVVVEAESALQLGTGFELKNSFSEVALGEGHIEYTGSNSYGSVPTQSITEYSIKINTPGTYQFKWRSRNGSGAEAFDQENDSWLKIESTRFYGVKNGVEHTFAKDDFIKVWIQDLNKWSWNCFGEHSGVNGMNVFATFDKAGTYQISIAGRSHGHPIDRFALYLPGKGSIAMNTSTSESASGCPTTEAKVRATDKGYGINKSDEVFEIDGELDNHWSFFNSEPGEYESSGKDLPNSEDLSFSYQMAYDDDYLFILADVQDQSLYSPTDESEYAKSDNVSLFFNPDLQHNESGGYGNDAIHIRMNYGVSDSPITGSESWNGGDGFSFVSKQTSTGYLLEAKIPWSQILGASASLTEGLKMGFEIQVDDNDDGELQNSLSWANDTKSNTAAVDTRKFGTLTLGPPTLKHVAKSGWEVIYVDSEEIAGDRHEAIDGDPATFWHTEWKDAQPGFPHEIQIDFHNTLNVAEVHYMHRQDQWGPNGAIGEYEIYVSNDSKNWGEPAAKGELEWPSDLATNYKLSHMITLDQVIQGRYLRLVALSETQNIAAKPFTAIAELDVVEGELLDEEDIKEELSVSSESKFSIFPNPVINNTFTINMDQEGDYLLTISDLAGQEIMKHSFSGSIAHLNSSQWKSGLYFVKLTSIVSTYEAKIVVE
ncbi:MAG: DUF5060 domain-containing protein [Cyclobacteriaceae bacterium]